MDYNDVFWNATVEELSRGYIFDEEQEAFVCLLCHQQFENGEIFSIKGRYFEARKAVKLHIEDAHGSVFHYLLNMDKKYTGLSDHQKDLLHYFKKGLSDKEIVKEVNGGSPSTIRSHRFKLREKEKQAKIFLALMSLLNENNLAKSNSNFIHFHKGAKMVDERYATTEKERKSVLTNYFKQGLDGPLETFPSKEKRKIIILQHIMKRFDPNQIYTERQVNDVLKKIHPDFATLRRYLIEYGFMERNKDCTEYRLKS